eukprot:3692508-Rhodomonas_salina.3
MGHLQGIWPGSKVPAPLRLRRPRFLRPNRHLQCAAKSKSHATAFLVQIELYLAVSGRVLVWDWGGLEGFGYKLASPVLTCTYAATRSLRPPYCGRHQDLRTTVLVQTTLCPYAIPMSYPALTYAYPGTRLPLSPMSGVVAYLVPATLSAFALSGTDIAYGASCLRAPYKMSGTDKPYGATPLFSYAMPTTGIPYYEMSSTN